MMLRDIYNLCLLICLQADAMRSARDGRACAAYAVLQCIANSSSTMLLNLRVVSFEALHIAQAHCNKPEEAQLRPIRINPNQP